MIRGGGNKVPGGFTAQIYEKILQKASRSFILPGGMRITKGGIAIPETEPAERRRFVGVETTRRRSVSSL